MMTPSSDAQDRLGKLLALTGDAALVSSERKTRRILVVEDEPEIQRLIEWILSLEGMEVELAGNGKEAILKLTETPSSALPDLILLDLLMPILNGSEFLEWKRRSSPAIRDVPVIITTGVSAPNLVQNCDVAGVLQKPISADLLIRKIRQTLPL